MEAAPTLTYIILEPQEGGHMFRRTDERHGQRGEERLRLQLQVARRWLERRVDAAARHRGKAVARTFAQVETERDPALRATEYVVTIEYAFYDGKPGEVILISSPAPSGWKVAAWQ